MTWRGSWLFARIADWQSKPTTSYKLLVTGWLCLGLALAGVFSTVAGRGSRMESAIFTTVALAGGLWLLYDAKA
jgi:hypothetical protein